MENQQVKQVVGQVISFWRDNNKNITDFFNKHADEVYAGAVAPGRNSGIYLLAHLVAVSDGLFTILGLGDKLYPELEKFIRESETNAGDQPEVADLKAKWNEINAKLEAEFAKQTTDWWLDRHMSVSEADFALEPNRNKLNVLLSRASHENYHRGQLVFLTRPTQG
ncbi:MAG: DinB family protein [Mucilaginibacter sp.]